MSLTIIVKDLHNCRDSKAQPREFKIKEREINKIPILQTIQPVDGIYTLQDDQLYERGFDFALTYIRTASDPNCDILPPKPLPYGFLQEQIFGRDYFIIDDFITGPNPQFEKARASLPNIDPVVSKIELHIANLLELVNSTHYLGLKNLTSKIAALIGIIFRKMPYDKTMIQRVNKIYPTLYNQQ